VRVDDFGGKVYIDEERLKKLEKLEKLQDFGFNSDFGNGMIAFANNDEMGLPLDSNELKVRIKIKNLDSLNFYIDNSMLKLNESLSKLTEQLQSEEFLNSIPEIDLKDLKDFDVEVDVDEIKDAIKESMKDFDENMKEFKFDMKEFKDSMKQFKENMNDLKKNMKELDSTKMMKFNKKIEIIDS
jgi:methyl-accepting chemotaxis protein